MKILAAVLICIALSACGSLAKSESENDATRGPYPTNWKSIVKQYIRSHYIDPTSVMDSEAAAPFKTRNTLMDATWSICIRNNAKNKFGGYTGRRLTILEVRNGQVDHTQEDYADPCQDAQFEPLPLN